MRKLELWSVTAGLALAIPGSPGVAQPDEPEYASSVQQDEEILEDTASRHYEGGAPGAVELKLFEARIFSFFGAASVDQVYRDLLSLSDLPMPLTACFRNGTTSQRQTIEDVAQKWQVAGSGVRFEFHKPNGAFRFCSQDRSLIRISIGGSSSWSAIGKQASEERFDYASMNIAYDYVLSAEREGVILHEFGHALGLEHEHLHSQSNCMAELDLDKIVAILAAEGNPRSRRQIEEDFAGNFEGERITETAFDAESVMLYSLRRAFFKNPDNATCIYPLRSALSDRDIDWVLARYPTDRQDAIKYKLAGYAFVQSRLASAVLTPETREKAVGFVSAYYPFADPADGEIYAKNASSILAGFAADIDEAAVDD